MTTVGALPATLSEAAFQTAVIDLAMINGWHVHHSRPARTAKGWATPITGHPGLPDLILARDSVVIIAELKSRQGRLTPGQRIWLAKLGQYGRLWTPADWPQIVVELTR